jgi:hypothetical protein
MPAAKRGTMTPLDDRDLESIVGGELPAATPRYNTGTTSVFRYEPRDGNVEAFNWNAPWDASKFNRKLIATVPAGGTVTFPKGTFRLPTEAEVPGQGILPVSTAFKFF